MIIFDRESRSFSVIDETRYYGKIKDALSDAGATFIRGGSKGLTKGVAGKLTGDDKKMTFKGMITGENKRRRQVEADKRARQLARIKSGTDNKSLALKYLANRHDERRADKALKYQDERDDRRKLRDDSHEENMARITNGK